MADPPPAESDPNAIEIRPALPSDWSELEPLFDTLDRLHREALPWLFQEPSTNPRPLSYLEELREGGLGELFVARAGQAHGEGDRETSSEGTAHSIGFAIVLLRSAPRFPVFVPQTHALVDNIVVHPQWQQRGLGRKLYAACEHWARDRGAQWLELTVYDFNESAARFYASLGFEPLTRRLHKPLGP
jgi:GNAT superfamily N-acetyltransferase